MPAALFDFAADHLEQHTSLDRLTARGTLRIALKAAGLSPKSLRVEQLRVAVDKVLARELEKRGVEGARKICAELSNALPGVSAAEQAPASAGADEIFRRLGSG